MPTPARPALSAPLTTLSLTLALLTTLPLAAAQTAPSMPSGSAPSMPTGSAPSMPMMAPSAPRMTSNAAPVLPAPLPGRGENLNIVSGGRSYASYLATPARLRPARPGVVGLATMTPEMARPGMLGPVNRAQRPSNGRYPAVILIHSFNGLEQGYRDVTDQLAAAGFVTLAVGWQTFEKTPSDAVVKQLLQDSLKTLAGRPDVDINRVGLTGYCAGGRYTMLFLPQMKEFKAGVAWYGFPDQGNSAAQPTMPSSLIGQLTAPMLIIHGSRDMASPIAGIYRYAQALDAANKTFKLDVYQGEPHGFLLRDSLIADTFASRDARRAMITYFESYLK